MCIKQLGELFLIHSRAASASKTANLQSNIGQDLEMNVVYRALGLYIEPLTKNKRLWLCAFVQESLEKAI